MKSIVTCCNLSIVMTCVLFHVTMCSRFYCLGLHV